MQKVYIVNGKRTPIGSFLGNLSSIKGVDLASSCTKKLLQETQIDPSIITEVIYGSVCTAGMKQSPCRQISILSGIPKNIPCWNVNKLCASGMKATTLGALNIRAGLS